MPTLADAAYIAWQINEFLYGVRAGRHRENADGVVEPEPILHFFWRATHHGVPLEDRLPQSEFDFYLDLLVATATAVGEEHTLNTKGSAFWNLYGSMHEIELPVFVLVNIVNNSYSTSHPELCDRLRKTVLKRAADWAKLTKGPNPPKPCPSYKPLLLGDASNDSRGFLPLERFLQTARECAAAQRARDAKVLNATFGTWITDDEGQSFDAFACVSNRRHADRMCTREAAREPVWSHVAMSRAWPPYAWHGSESVTHACSSQDVVSSPELTNHPDPLPRPPPRDHVVQEDGDAFEP